MIIGFGLFNKIGVELEFGIVMGDYFEEFVLLIKIVWGGYLFYKNFWFLSVGMFSEEKLVVEFE